MTLFYVSITITILASLFYHIMQKSTPADVNPAVSFIVTYGVSILICLALVFIFFPIKGGLIPELKKLNWASYCLALALVGLEIGFLLAYRSGWNLGVAAVMVNVVASLLAIPIALLVFKEKLTPINIIGIIVCLIGLVMMNWKR